jgi:prophage regulatory protein
MNIDEMGLVRLPKVLELYPVCESSWWEGIKIRRYPRPVKINKRTVAWRKSDIAQLLADPENSAFP